MLRQQAWARACWASPSLCAPWDFMRWVKTLRYSAVIGEINWWKIRSNDWKQIHNDSRWKIRGMTVSYMRKHCLPLALLVLKMDDKSSAWGETCMRLSQALYWEIVVARGFLAFWIWKYSSRHHLSGKFSCSKKQLQLPGHQSIDVREVDITPLVLLVVLILLLHTPGSPDIMSTVTKVYSHVLEDSNN